MKRICKKEDSELKISRLTIGKVGESLACQFLKSNGYDIIKRNWRCPAGELDIVARDRGRIIFVEVKTVVTDKERGQYLFNSVTEAKKRKLRMLVKWCLRANFNSHRTDVQRSNRISSRSKTLKVDYRPDYRIDAVGVLLEHSTMRLLRIEHLPAAV